MVPELTIAMFSVILAPDAPVLTLIQPSLFSTLDPSTPVNVPRLRKLIVPAARLLIVPLFTVSDPPPYVPWPNCRVAVLLRTDALFRMRDPPVPPEDPPISIVPELLKDALR